MPLRLRLHCEAFVAGEELYERVFGDKVLTVLNYGEYSPFAYVPPYCSVGVADDAHNAFYVHYVGVYRYLILVDERKISLRFHIK